MSCDVCPAASKAAAKPSLSSMPTVSPSSFAAHCTPVAGPPDTPTFRPAVGCAMTTVPSNSAAPAYNNGREPKVTAAVMGFPPAAAALTRTPVIFIPTDVLALAAGLVRINSRRPSTILPVADVTAAPSCSTVNTASPASLSALPSCLLVTATPFCGATTALKFSISADAPAPLKQVRVISPANSVAPSARTSEALLETMQICARAAPAPNAAKTSNATQAGIFVESVMRLLGRREAREARTGTQGRKQEAGRGVAPSPPRLVMARRSANAAEERA